jgi:hypothetical protein
MKYEAMVTLSRHRWDGCPISNHAATGARQLGDQNGWLIPRWNESRRVGANNVTNHYGEFSPVPSQFRTHKNMPRE